MPFIRKLKDTMLMYCMYKVSLLVKYSSTNSIMIIGRGSYVYYTVGMMGVATHGVRADIDSAGQ